MRRSITAVRPLVRLAKSPESRSHYSTSRAPIQVPENARLRFAPSPTGYLHLGGLRTALFNQLLARKWKGKWILRVEDTDQTRLVPGAVDSLRKTLDWAGLNYDEGVGVGGSKGPYVQSERLDLYRHHAKQLLDHDRAYECFCTPAEVLDMRQGLLKAGHRHGYDGRCRHLTDEDRARRKRAGEKYVVRFKVGFSGSSFRTVYADDQDEPGGEALPRDLIYGDVQIPALQAPDDFIILKSDGWPTYHLASVVDDHTMEVSHVLRGEEWMTSVPKHHALYRAFGWTPPSFAHLPLLVNADGTKLSKRTGDVRVEYYQEKGYEPEALLNFVALMGWDHHSALEELAQRQAEMLSTTWETLSVEAAASSSTDIPTDGALLPPQTRSDSHSYYDVFTPGQLVAAFSLDHVNHKKAAVNVSKLDFINKITLRRKAGRLGDDGVMVELGKEELEADQTSRGHQAERAGLVTRLQAMLREKKVLKGSRLVEDTHYVGKVFDAELARTVILKDISSSSIFFFLDPDYNGSETSGLLQTCSPVRYVELVEAVCRKLESLLAGSGGNMTEDIGWAAINAVLQEGGVQSRVQLLTPMRHALSGRKKGPSVPAIMAVLGGRRSLDRLQAGLVHVRRVIRGLA